MANYHVRIIGGWCGNRMVLVAEHLAEKLEQAGYPCRVTHQSVWETYALPPSVDLILQLLPAFNESETNCPVVNIKPLLLDLDHPPTIDKIFEVVRQHYLRP